MAEIKNKMTLSNFECKIHIGIPDASLIHAKPSYFKRYLLHRINLHTRATDKNNKIT